MDAKDLGLPTDANPDPGTPPVVDPKPDQPTDGSPTDPGKDGGSPTDPGTGNATGQTPGQEGADAPKEGADKRVDDLMSKWQTEEHSHGVTKSELQLYKEKYGELPTDGQPSTPAHGQPVADADKPSFLKEGWDPKSMDEMRGALVEAAEYGAKSALKSVGEQNQAKIDAQQAVDNFVRDVKQADSEFNDTEFFAYANKMGFPLNSVQDLRAVYRSHRELLQASKDSATDALKNKDGRGDEPVNKPGSGGGQSGGKTDYNKIRQAGSATELVHDALNK